MDNIDNELPKDLDLSNDFHHQGNHGASVSVVSEVVEKEIPSVINGDGSPSNKPNEGETKSWLRRHKLGVAMGAFALSTFVPIALHPSANTEHELLDHAPWVATGVVASEALWIGGAAMMLTSGGSKIGNPLSVKSRMEEIKSNISDSPWFKAGLMTNTIGALGTAGVVITGVTTSLPAESWGVIGIAGLDIASTVAIRTGIYRGLRTSRDSRDVSERNYGSTEDGVSRSPDLYSSGSEKAPKISVRKANEEDLSRLADIDLARFRKAYGADIPTKEEVIDTLTHRLHNSPDLMYVCELDNKVEGFVSAFCTDKPIEEFVSWEESTSNGTLDGKVIPDGKYAYVVNMTINPNAVRAGGEEMLIASLVAEGIDRGTEYAYFVSRMPQFKRWVEGNHKQDAYSNEELNELANTYLNTKKKQGEKEVRYDFELRMYEEAGFDLVKVVPNGFQDAASMNYGVVAKVEIPPHNKFIKNTKIARKVMALSLHKAAQYPRIIKRVL